MANTKKITKYKGFFIVMKHDNTFEVFTADEWTYPTSMRNVEFECGSLQECKDNIDSYNTK